MDQVKSKHKAMHPGAYVKHNVIPEGMTVTKAAKLLGVGRPALSNFLNSNADLSPEMAVRLERAFGADSKMLIELQAKLDLIEETVEREPVISGVYAPQLAEIKAVEIKRWAEENICARQELPALLRRLVHSTGRELTRVDFPAFDEAERRGWDGLIETSVPTPWIPGGKSGWELSCRKDITRKADIDWNKNLKAVRPKDRNETTFVFVTARIWHKKREWAEEKAALREWKDVRAYDAGDLEQWLEQSAPTQIWFAERLGQPQTGYRSIEQCWREWTKDCEPSLWPALFAPSVKRFAKEFAGWLSDETDRPFILAADSQEEALAYLRCLAKSLETDPPGLADRMIVFDTPRALERLKSVDRLPIIAIAPKPKVERKIGFLRRRCDRVIVRPRNSVYGDPDIALDRLDFMDFHKALEPIGYGHEEIERLARESACSPTILRRRVSKIPKVQTPPWADDAKIARKLIPTTMVGAWNSTTPGDRAVVLRLSRSDDYTILEENVTELLRLKDHPLWSAGDYQGVVSRIDALFGIASFVIRTDLDNFFAVAKDVLCKSDPSAYSTSESVLAAEAPQDAPSHSDALRSGIRETLILLAVYGNPLFHRRLGFDAESEVESFIKKLLSPFEQDQITFYGTALPDFAEAAPEVVLSAIETDVRNPKPVIYELLKTPRHSLLCHSLRTPLLWTLQVLAWNSQLFPRVVSMLAKICEMSGDEGEDNWSPKPQETLASFFDSWNPQTAATLDQRTKALKVIRRAYPAIGWSICIGQLDGSVLPSPNYRPRWRDDGQRSARQIPEAELRESERRAMDFLLNWDLYDENMLGDLVERLPRFNESSQLRIWDRIGKWANSDPSDAAKGESAPAHSGLFTLASRTGRDYCTSAKGTLGAQGTAARRPDSAP